jgi:hypothetical protein
VKASLSEAPDALRQEAKILTEIRRFAQRQGLQYFKRKSLSLPIKESEN